MAREPDTGGGGWRVAGWVGWRMFGWGFGYEAYKLEMADC